MTARTLKPATLLAGAPEYSAALVSQYLACTARGCAESQVRQQVGECGVKELEMETHSSPHHAQNMCTTQPRSSHWLSTHHNCMV